MTEIANVGVVTPPALIEQTERRARALQGAAIGQALGRLFRPRAAADHGAAKLDGFAPPALFAFIGRAGAAGAR